VTLPRFLFAENEIAFRDWGTEGSDPASSTGELDTNLSITHSNGISALQLQSQLGLGSYRTAWMLWGKLRRAMINPEREPLCGIVEADETRRSSRGVGKMLVAGAVEVDAGKPRRPAEGDRGILQGPDPRFCPRRSGPHRPSW
jgi:hypothetical protein